MADSKSGKAWAQLSPSQPASDSLSGRSRVYFDITIGGRNEGRVVFELVRPFFNAFPLLHLRLTQCNSSTMVCLIIPLLLLSPTNFFFPSRPQDR